MSYSKHGEEKQSATSKLNSGSSVWDYLAAQATDFLTIESFKEYRTQAEKLYGMFTKDSEYFRENNKLHRERGALRSGNGDQGEAIRR